MHYIQNSYQKWIAVILSIIIIIASSIVYITPKSVNAAEPTTFTDVKTTDYFYKAVESLASREIVNGYGDGTYRPYASITRAHAAKILALVLGLDTTNVQNPGFTDVKTTDWYYGSVAALANAGIMKGSGNTFKPSAKLTRAQMAKIFTIGFGFSEEPLKNNPFKDVQSNDWFVTYLPALIKNGITKGTTATTFSPYTNATRGQLAVFILRSEIASKPQTIQSEIMNITNTSIELTNGTFTLTEDQRKWLNPNNLAALKGAIIKLDVKDSIVKKVVSLEITAQGRASEDTSNLYKNHLVFDGNGATLEGNLLVNGDYVSIENVTINGDLEIGKEVQNSFNADGVTVKGDTVISETAQAVTSLNTSPHYQLYLKFLAENPTVPMPVISFGNTNLQSVYITRSNTVILGLRSKTTIVELNMSSSTILQATPEIFIPKVIVTGGSTLTINATVNELIIHTTQTFTLNGLGSVQDVTIISGNNIIFDLIRKIQKLELQSKNSYVTLGNAQMISYILIPKDVDIKIIIKNFQGVKTNIENINGEKNPYIPVLPPVSGGGGGGGPSDTIPPTVTGVTNGTTYKTNITPVFTEGTATLAVNAVAAVPFTSGTIISAEGSYVLVVRDSAGNKTTINFTIDKTAPIVTGVSNGGEYLKVTPVFAEEIAVLVKNGSVSGTYTTGTEISEEGDYQLVVTDAVGNLTIINFKIDRTPPRVYYVSNGATYNTNVEPFFFEGTATLSRNNGSANAYNYYDSISADGVYVLVVTDVAGNKTTVNFTIDKTAPIVTGVTKGTSYKTDVTPVFTEGTATLSKNGATAVPFTTDTTITEEGTYVLVVKDTVGNANTINFTIDKTNPVISGNSIANIAGTSVDIKFTSSEVGTAYYVVVPQGSAVPSAVEVKAGVDYSSITVAKAASFNVTASEITKAVTGLTPTTDYAIYTIVVDSAGNISNVLEITNAVHTLVDASLSKKTLQATDVNVGSNNTLVLSISGATFTAGAGNPIAISALEGTATNAVVTVVQDSTDNTKAIVTVTNNGTAVAEGEIITFNVLTTNLTGSTATNKVTINLSPGLVFNGSSNVSIPAYGNINFSGQSNYTIAGWIRPTGSGFIFEKSRGNDDYHRTQIALSYDSTKQDIIFKLDDYNGDGWQSFGGNSSNVPLNEWTHIAIVKSERNIDFYKNGIKDATTGTLAGIHSFSKESLGVATIGRNFNGSIDEFTIWKTALYVPSFINIMNNQFNISNSNLVGYFPFNERTGLTTSNDAPVGNDGTLSSDTIWGAGKY